MERQEKELQELSSSLETCTILKEGLLFPNVFIKVILEQPSVASDVNKESAPPPRMSKAAKRREKAAAKAQLLAESVEQARIKSASSVSTKEYNALEKILSERGLAMHIVKPITET